MFSRKPIVTCKSFNGTINSPEAFSEGFFSWIFESFKAVYDVFFMLYDLYYDQCWEWVLE